MPQAMRDPLLFSPLTPTSDFTEFVSKLEISDVRTRFGCPLDAERLLPLLAPVDPACRAIGAWKGRTLVGVGMLAKLAGDQCEFALLVRSDVKRRRIGTALAHRAFSEALELGAREVVAHVRSDNTAALGLVRSLGFLSVGGPGLELFFVAHLSARQAAV